MANPPVNMDDLIQMMMAQQSGDGWFDRIAGQLAGMPGEIWQGINQMGSQFWGDPTKPFGDEQVLGDYGRNTIEGTIDIAKDPLGYVRENPGYALVDLLGLAAGGAGMASRALRHVDDVPTPAGPNPLGIRGGGQVVSRWDDVPEDYWYHTSPEDRFGSIRRTGLDASRRETPESAGTHFTERPHDYPFIEDNPRNLYRVRRDQVPTTRRSDSDFYTTENIKPSLLDVYEGEGRWGNLNPDVDDFVNEPGFIRRGIDRFLHEERGGNLPDEPTNIEDLWDALLRKDRNTRQPELTGDIESRTPSDLSPERQGIRAVLEGTSLNTEPHQVPILSEAAAARAAAGMDRFAEVRRLMQGEQSARKAAKVLDDPKQFIRPSGMRERGGTGIDEYESLVDRPSRTRVTDQFPADYALEGEQWRRALDNEYLEDDYVQIRDPNPYAYAGRYSPISREMSTFKELRHENAGWEPPPPRVDQALPINPQPSTMQVLTEALLREGTPEGRGRFVPEGYRQRPDVPQSRPAPVQRAVVESGVSPRNLPTPKAKPRLRSPAEEALRARRERY